jgi:hypothetical protein
MLSYNMPARDDSVGSLNGEIPATYADQIIKYRMPYTMPGERLVAAEVTADQFNEATFLHVIDKPFEVHRLHVELTGLTGTVDDNAIPDTQPATLDRRVRLRIDLTEKNDKVTKNPALVSTLVDALTHIWEWEVPYTITKQEGFTVAVDTQALPVICFTDPEANTPCDPGVLTFTFVRVEIQFQGYLIVIRPASDSR